jgi:arginine/ornithine transport system substrate-binding protein
MKRLRPALLALAAALLAAPALPAFAQDGTPLRLGVEGNYPPFAELGTDGKLKGFDIDIAHALCERLKRRCELVTSDFDALIPALNAKKFDAIVASMSITPARLKAVDFSQPYYDSVGRVVARADASFEVSAAGLKGRKLGVQRTTIYDRFVSEKLKEAKIVRYSKQDEVYLDLAAGRLDAAMADAISIDQGFLKTPQGKGFALRGPAFDDPAYFGTGAGIAVRKGDTALKSQIDGALKAMLADGSHKKMSAKYFDFDISPRATRSKP